MRIDKGGGYESAVRVQGLRRHIGTGGPLDGDDAALANQDGLGRRYMARPHIEYVGVGDS